MKNGYMIKDLPVILFKISTSFKIQTLDYLGIYLIYLYNKIVAYAYYAMTAADLNLALVVARGNHWW